MDGMNGTDGHGLLAWQVAVVPRDATHSKIFANAIFGCRGGL